MKQMNRPPLFEPTLMDELVISDDFMEFSETEFALFLNINWKEQTGS